MSDFSGLTARDLLDGGQCTPSCLLARAEEDSGCKCRCAGEFHAILADTFLDGSPVVAERIGSVRRGDVIAAGLRSGACPVGLVEAVDGVGIRLRLMSFLDGTFDLPRVVFWREIVEIKHAGLERDEDEVATARAIAGGPTTKVFDTRPLGQFQTYWEYRNGFRKCSVCARRIPCGKYFFMLRRGPACLHCVDRDDLYDDIVDPAVAGPPPPDGHPEAS